MMGMYDDFDAARARGDFASLPELHALSSGLKALSTDITAAGIETCRRQCGGHGYMLASGLPTLFASYVQNCTWEGDNSGECRKGMGLLHTAVSIFALLTRALVTLLQSCTALRF
jgi:acyl-CoA oxidase